MGNQQQQCCKKRHYNFLIPSAESSPGNQLQVNGKNEPEEVEVVESI